jgi:pilus assembly protein Flp/PilA
MLKIVTIFASDEKGATAIEYGLIVAVLSLAMVFALGMYADNLEILLGHPESALQEALQRYQ